MNDMNGMGSRPAAPRRGWVGRGTARVLVVASGILAVASMAQAGPNVAQGKTLFASHCAVCHKADASGGVKLGDTESADLRAPKLEEMYHHNEKLLERAILKGLDEDGKPLDTVMPHWQGQLTTAQLTDIIAYLKTLHPH